MKKPLVCSIIIYVKKILRTEELDNCWRKREATRAEANATHQFKLYIYNKVTMEEQAQFLCVKKWVYLYIYTHIYIDVCESMC